MKKSESLPESFFEEKRREMVQSQIMARGVRNSLVLEAMQQVPRHVFVPEDMQEMAYLDRPLPIGHGQTISQPYIVAYMTELLLLGGGEKILEVGTGLGYQTAVLASIAREVYTVECVFELATRARELLQELGYSNIHSQTGDGSIGWEANAPYEAILVTAAGPAVPQALKKQLKTGGYLVMPVGQYRYGQHIVRVTKGAGERFHEERFIDVAFVPLLGKCGWDPE